MSFCEKRDLSKTHHSWYSAVPVVVAYTYSLPVSGSVGSSESLWTPLYESIQNVPCSHIVDPLKVMLTGFVTHGYDHVASSVSSMDFAILVISARRTESRVVI